MHFYQVCSNDAPGIKTDPAPGVTDPARGEGEGVNKLEHWNKKGKLQNTSSLKLEGIELLILGT